MPNCHCMHFKSVAIVTNKKNTNKHMYVFSLSDTVCKMVMLEVFQETISVKYKAFLLSKATFITLVWDIMSICLPFILSYHSGGLWQTHDIIYLQPKVSFNGDFLFLAMASRKPIVCSSFPYYRKYLSALDACSNIKIREVDENLDDQVDALQFQVTIHLPESVQLDSLHLVLLLNYSFQEPCHFQMESAVIYQETNLKNVFQASVYADLGLLQSESLKCSKNGSSNIILPIVQDANDYLLENFIRNYVSKKMRTTLINPVATFNSVRDSYFTINLKLKYPEQKIYYTPKIWQILKGAWIQYLAIYIITKWLISKVKRYIFKTNLVLLYKDRR